MYYDYYTSAIWDIEITASDTHVTAVLFVDRDIQTVSWNIQKNTLTDMCKTQLEEYFAHKRKTFDIPLQQTGTIFQQSVRQSLQTVSYWKTLSYGEFAAILWNTAAIRAVASAIGKNKIDILIPCHRVMWANWALTWYNGGIERKRFLLELEQENIFSI